MEDIFYKNFLKSIAEKERQLAILIAPDKFNIAETVSFLKKIPKETTHLFVGGSTVANGETEATVKALKAETQLPIFLFPGDWSHITPFADALLFLTLLSGRNAEYLIGQQIKSISKLKNSALAGQFMGAKIIYLEAGSGAEFPVKPEIISEVKKAIKIPLIVGGGIKTDAQKNTAYEAGTDMVVMGTAFE